MLLKNYFVYSGLLFGATDNKMISTSGIEIQSRGLFTQGSKCLVGSGSRPAKVDDHALEAEIQGINTTFNVNISDAGLKVVNIISNLTNKTVNISEVGIACYQNSNTCILMTRTVLDEPIILEVGDVVVIETQFA